MVQLWVNLPAQGKLVAPGYQTVRNADTPSVALPGRGWYGARDRRRITLGGAVRRARSRRWTSGTSGYARRRRWPDLPLPAGRNAMVVVLRGTVLVNDSQVAREAQMVLLDRDGTDVRLEANNEVGGAAVERRPDRRADRRLRTVRDELVKPRSSRPSSISRAAALARFPRLSAPRKVPASRLRRKVPAAHPWVRSPD
jgi:hypothetical protein